MHLTAGAPKGRCSLRGSAPTGYVPTPMGWHFPPCWLVPWNSEGFQTLSAKQAPELKIPPPGQMGVSYSLIWPPQRGREGCAHRRSLSSPFLPPSAQKSVVVSGGRTWATWPAAAAAFEATHRLSSQEQQRRKNGQRMVPFSDWAHRGRRREPASPGPLSERLLARVRASRGAPCAQASPQSRLWSVLF